MVKYIKNEPVGKSPYYTCFVDKAFIGTIEQECDGFFYLFPNVTGAFWASWVLIDLGRKLEALNEAWNQRISAELSKLSLEDKHRSPCTDWTPSTPPKK